MGISPTAEPNTQLCVPSTQPPLPNTQHTAPNIQLPVPNTKISKPNTRNSKPKLSTVWSNFSKKIEGLGIGLGGSESVYFAHSEPNPPCSSLHMRGSRSVGPTPPFDPSSLGLVLEVQHTIEGDSNIAHQQNCGRIWKIFCPASCVT